MIEGNEQPRPVNADGKQKRVKNRFNFIPQPTKEERKESTYWVDNLSTIKNPFRLAKFYVCSIDGC